MTTRTETIHRAFLAAKWPHDLAALATVKVDSERDAQEAIAYRLPAAVVGFILRDKRNEPGAATMRAFRQARDVRSVYAVAAPRRAMQDEDYRARTNPDRLATLAEAQAILREMAAERETAAKGSAAMGALTAAVWSKRTAQAEATGANADASNPQAAVPASFDDMAASVWSKRAPQAEQQESEQ